ncbi:MAG: hypothetical protein Q7S09_05920 [bacterium]|nr:hypothetical protein [bacterium]
MKKIFPIILALGVLAAFHIGLAQAATVEIKANGAMSAITVPYYSNVTLSWSASNLLGTAIGPSGEPGCAGDWGERIPNVWYPPGPIWISKENSGQQLFEGMTATKTFTIMCPSDGSSVQSSVTVTVQPDPNPLKVDLTINGNDVKPGYTYTLPWNGGPEIGQFEDLKFVWEANNPDATCSLGGAGYPDLSRFGFPGTASGEWSISSLKLVRDGHSTDRSSQKIVGGTWIITCTGRGETATDQIRVVTALPPKVIRSIELKANGQSGTVTVPRGTDVLLTWTATNLFSDTRCLASGDWSGYKTSHGSSGQEFTHPLYANKVYTIKCDVSSNTFSDVKNADTVTIYVATDWDALLTKYSSGWDAQGSTWGYITDSGVTQWYRKEGSQWVKKSSAAEAKTPYTEPSPAAKAVCDDIAQSIVNAAGGCSNVDKAAYQNVYSACCAVITKTTLLQLLNNALADGKLDKSEKSSLLDALNTYLSK